MKRLLATAVLSIGLWFGAVAAPVQAQGCIASAIAGGTVDAITVPLLPCSTTTNLLLLTLTGPNTITTPTLQQTGFKALPIVNPDGTSLAVGALPGASWTAMLYSTGTSWKLLSVTSAASLTPVTGTGAVVLQNTPTINTPIIVSATMSGTTTLPGSGAISSSGRIGIGVSPTLYLDIKVGSTSNVQNAARIVGHSAAWQVLNQAATQNWYFGVNDADNNKLYIGAGANAAQGVPPLITLDTTNTVGVGNTIPTAGLATLFVSTIDNGSGASDNVFWVRHQGSQATNESIIRHEHFSDFALTAAIPQPIFTGIGNRGTIAVPVGLLSGDYLLIVDGRGYNTVANSDTSAQMSFQATETWSPTAQGSRIKFLTTGNGTITPSVALTIDQDSSAVFKESLTVAHVLNAVNRVQVSGSTAGNPTIIEPTGTDASISMFLQGKGVTGDIFLINNGVSTFRAFTIANAINTLSVQSRESGIPVQLFSTSDAGLSVGLNNNSGVLTFQSNMTGTPVTMMQLNPVALAARAISITPSVAGNPSVSTTGGGLTLMSSSGTTTLTDATVSATMLNVTNSGVPANGIYSPAANTLGFASNSTRGFVQEASQRFISGSLTSIGSGPASNQNAQLQMHSTTSFLNWVGLFGWGNDTGASTAALVFTKSKSGTIGSHGAVTSGDTLGQYIVRGDDGTNYPTAGSANFFVDGAVSAGIVPGRFVISTATAAGTSTEGLRVTSTQQVNLSSGYAQYVTVLGSAASGASIGTGAGNLNIGSTGGTTTMTDAAIVITNLSTDATHTDRTVCQDTTSKQLYFGSGAAGVCLGTSSERYKRDIVDVKYGLTEVMALRPIEYRYREGYGNNGDHELFGFTAEQMNPWMPKLVGLDVAGRPNSVDMVGLIAVLTKAVQEQQAEIVRLNRRVQ